jgi:hypothetical protein
MQVKQLKDYYETI